MDGDTGEDGTGSSLTATMEQLAQRQLDLDADLQAALDVKASKKAKLDALQERMVRLQMDRSVLAGSLDRLESIVLPAKSLELRELVQELMDAQLEKLSDLKLRVRKSEIMAEAVDIQLKELDSDFAAGHQAWTEMLQEWPLVLEKSRKMAEIGALRLKVREFEAKHGSLNDLAKDIEDLQLALAEITAKNERLEKKAVEVTEKRTKNETVLKQLNVEIRTLRNRKQAKLKLLKKAVQEV